jgi:dTDP-glucose 4,6-dehydratase
MPNKKLNAFIAKSCDDAISSKDLIHKLINNCLFITGCGGFVGRWLLEFILNLNTRHSFNIKVYATTRIWDLSDEKLAHLVSHQNFHFSEVDVRSTFSIPDDVNYVIHLAGSPDRKEIVADPLKLIDTITLGTKNLLEAINDHGCIVNTLNFSSGYVNPTKTLDSDANASYSVRDTSDLLAVYSESKRMSEVLCNVYSRKFQLQIVNVRPYALVGPLMDLTKVWAINNFFLDAINNNPIKIEGNKLTLRSYLFAPDMALTTLVFLCSKNSTSAVDLGSFELVSLESLALCIKNNFNSTEALVFNERLNSSEKIHSFAPAFSNSGLGDVVLRSRKNLDEAIKITKQWIELNELS